MKHLFMGDLENETLTRRTRIETFGMKHLHAALSSHENVVRGNAIVGFHLPESDARMFHPMLEGPSELGFLVIICSGKNKRVSTYWMEYFS